ncbi:QueC-like queuosine biosynthesis [Burkholderia phage BcepGomr]|uniref:QueC-like queuosine biosynthesis n=1 Tax=Burkholderia phage BcepGomr TaxID=437329 RepID=UPI00015034F4|nr:QueC-like queuosine biosynthesis [Burkholderia phage BcepGomr]ABP63606.1 BcepGomrgp35 [Burkholderia phage BcepGomr]
MSKKTAVIVFSGGQDSTTILGKAIAEGYRVFPIAFTYGQKHAIELEQAAKIVDHFGLAGLKIVDLSALGEVTTSALIGTDGDVNKPSDANPSLPASFVPNRNAAFLTLAHAYAQQVGADELWTGVCMTDYSGYPDCRDSFINALAATLNIGYDTSITIKTPLMYIDKAETFRMAELAGCLDVVIEMSHTCYNGVRSNGEVPTNPSEGGGFFDWGHGCGECPACKLRAGGWREYLRRYRPDQFEAEYAAPERAAREAAEQAEQEAQRAAMPQMTGDEESHANEAAMAAEAEAQAAELDKGQA